MYCSVAKQIYRSLVFPLLLAGLVIGGSLLYGQVAHAQSTISPDDLTAANGWQCNADNSSCKNTKQGSEWYGATATCTTVAVGEGLPSLICDATKPNGTGASSVNVEGGGVQTQATYDAQGNNTSFKTNTDSESGACSLTSPSTWGSCLLQAVGSSILSIANWLLSVAGVLFNLVMFYGVFQFANTIGNAPGVLTAWGILRDIANMALLFGFIFMGIATILDTSRLQGFTAKNALPKLLIFAILMNFSLFTAEAMIDVSNALASSIYLQADVSQCNSTDATCTVNYGLAGNIMQSTGLAGIWKNGTPNLGITQYLGLALFATIGAIVFFAAAIMLAIRVIVLTFLMIVSPIGFAGMAIPPLQKFAGEWWQRVIHQAFYAPIMLLLILISLKVSDSFTSAGVNNALGDTTNTIGNVVTDPNASAISVVLIFMLIIGFLVASLIFANRFGAMGATAAVGWGKKIVLGSYGRAGGVLGRNTIGRVGNWAQKSYKSQTGLRRTILRTPGLKGLDAGAINATGALKAAKFGGTKSFEDIETRKRERAKTIVGLDKIDAVKKAKTPEDAERALKDIADKDLPDLINALKGNESALQHIAEGLSAEKFEKVMNNEEFKDGATKAKMRDLRFENLASTAKSAQDAEEAYLRDPADAILKKEHEEAQKKLGDEIKQFGGKDAGILAQSKHSVLFQDPTFAAAVSDDQFKAFKNSNALTSVQMRTFEDRRNERRADPKYIALNIPTMSIEDIQKLKPGTLSTPAVLSAIGGGKLALLLTKPDKLDDNDLQAIVDHVKANTLTDPKEAGAFMARIKGDPRIEKIFRDRYDI